MYMKDCRVEGAQSATQIIGAIRYFNERHGDLDCLVVMRGGGSLEDLQAFNNEQVIKEMFASRLPVIAAIGHDRDVPLACLVADRFTSTPTAAAMLINNTWARLKAELPRYENSILRSYQTSLDDSRSQVLTLTHRLTGSFYQVFQRFNYLAEKVTRGRSQIQTAMEAARERASFIINQVTGGLGRAIQQGWETAANAEKLLTAASPERNLKLGYSLAYAADGKIVRKRSQVKQGDQVMVKLHQGSLDTKVINID
jgi:exodeoxyribonuclease VII large subunit